MCRLGFTYRAAAGSREPDLALPGRAVRGLDLDGPGRDKAASCQRGERRARPGVKHARLQEALLQPGENGSRVVCRVGDPPPVVSGVTAAVLVPLPALVILGFLIGVVDEFEVLTLPRVQWALLRVCRFFPGTRSDAGAHVSCRRLRIVRARRAAGGIRRSCWRNAARRAGREGRRNGRRCSGADAGLRPTRRHCRPDGEGLL